MESAEELCRSKKGRSIGSCINSDVQNLRKAHKSEVGISLSIIPPTNFSLSSSPSAHPYQIPETKVTSQIKSSIKSQLLPQLFMTLQCLPLIQAKSLVMPSTQFPIS